MLEAGGPSISFYAGPCKPCRRTPAISQADWTGMQSSYTKCPVAARGNNNKAGLRPKRLRRAEL